MDVCYWAVRQAVVTTELQIDNVREFGAPFGQISDFSQINCDHDMMFTW